MRYEERFAGTGLARITSVKFTSPIFLEVLTATGALKRGSPAHGFKRLNQGFRKRSSSQSLPWIEQALRMSPSGLRRTFMHTIDLPQWR